MRLAPEDLTVDELEEIGKVAGNEPLSALMKGEVTPAALRAVLWITARRDDPDFTLEDAGKLRLSDIEVDDEADPTEAGG